MHLAVPQSSPSDRLVQSTIHDNCWHNNQEEALLLVSMPKEPQIENDADIHLAAMPDTG